MRRREYRQPLPVEKAPQIVIAGDIRKLCNLGLALSLMENANRETSLKHRSVKDRHNQRWILEVSGGTTKELNEIRNLAISEKLVIVVDGLRIRNLGGSKNERGG